MDFSQFVASGAAAIAEGAVVERIRCDSALALLRQATTEYPFVQNRFRPSI